MAPRRTTKSTAKTPAARSDGHVQSLNRAIAILNRLAEAGDGVALTDIAKDVKLSTSTAHRLLTTLQAQRYVRFDAAHKLWFIGVQAFIAGNGFLKSRDIVEIARPHMRRLREETGETVNLAVIEKGEAVYLAQMESREMMRTFARPGNRVGLHCSGVGKAYLATLPEGELTKYLPKSSLEAVTNRTITSLDALRTELRRIRKMGFALDDEEQAGGVRCIASVIYNEAGEPACAISVSGPATRLTADHVQDWGKKVRAAGQAITAEIGGKAPP